METIKLTEVADVLVSALKEGRTEFTFIKKDGTLRNAVGTLKMELIPESGKQFKTDGEEKPKRDDQTSFWDMEKLQWRCCKYVSVTSINGKEVV